MDEGLVGVDDLLEVESLVAVVGEGGLAVEVFLEGRNGILVGCGVESDGLYYDTSKFASYADFAHLDLENLNAFAAYLSP